MKDRSSLAFSAVPEATPRVPASKTAEEDSGKIFVSMTVNGQARTITVEPRMTLLDTYQLHAKRRS